MEVLNMNRKILAIFALLILAVSVSAVSAFSLSDILGSSSDAGQVTIDGVDFNIPDGFVEQKNLAIDGDVNETDGVKYTTWSKTYANNENKVISIGVATYEGVEVTDEMPQYIGGDEVSINGVNGYEYNVNGFEGFTYAKDGKLVIISTNDGNLLQDLIVK